MTAIKAGKSVRSLRGKTRRGSAVLESVIVLMLLLTCAFGIVEFGWYFYVRHSFEGAARQGSRAGIVPGAANSDVTTAVTTYITAEGLSGSGYATKVESPLGTSCTVGNLSSGADLYVTVYATWSIAGSGFRPLQLIGASKVVSGVSMMRHE